MVKYLTREDVLEAIKRNGNKAEGLDLSGARFVEKIDLSGLNLSGIILKGILCNHSDVNGVHFGAKFNGSNMEGAILSGAMIPSSDFGLLIDKPTILRSADLRNALIPYANFEGADLSHVQLQAEKYDNNPPGTSLFGANFQKATLYHTNFKGCDCRMAKFEGAYVSDTDITEARLENIDWGKYKIGEENDREYLVAEQCYRKLKVWYKQSGYDDTAAKFYYREKESGRKGARHWYDRATGWLMWALFGYGERWRRILFWIAGLVLFFTLIYFVIGTLTPNSFLDCLYFSAVSFIALGYGSWITGSTGWVRGLGVVETFLGFFLMTLLLVTFMRKWSR